MSTNQPPGDGNHADRADRMDDAERAGHTDDADRGDHATPAPDRDLDPDRSRTHRPLPPPAGLGGAAAAGVGAGGGEAAGPGGPAASGPDAAGLVAAGPDAAGAAVPGPALSSLAVPGLALPGLTMPGTARPGRAVPSVPAHPAPLEEGPPSYRLPSTAGTPYSGGRRDALRHEHVAVVDLGYGDAGKGTIVDYLCRRGRATGNGIPVSTVVRFNGGPQAAHNVVTDDGRHHTFAQFGSGMFTHGVETHLSRFMLVDPLALAAEADHLTALGATGAFAWLSIDREALLVTPYHAAANQARERARGDARHGSCGMGVGETAAYALAHPEDAPRVGDCQDPPRLRRLLTALHDRLADELGPLPLVPDVDDCVTAFRGFAQTARIVDRTHTTKLLRRGRVVFEGAQGVLLDEWYGFHPYTTWSTTTFANVDELLADAGESALRLGVVRTFTPRHGPGPLVTEEPRLTAALPDRYNGTGPWQGAFRVGHFDAVAYRYAVEVCGGVDALAVTHLDAPWQVPLGVCHAYRVDGERIDRLPVGPREDLAGRAELTARLMRAEPVYQVQRGAQRYWPDDGCPHRAEDWSTTVEPRAWPNVIADALGAPVVVRSSGPRTGDKAQASVLLSSNK
ncbi:adenylosuccinate synthetase [Yinghuangia soli]|uniref:Adenylosuccinate synthetase n=1 Tax=Yinghuangia soli TaxID=2908204 RepID=A0AA41PTY6_9ACTN|nr:adenylosuccinate synthetase [Yinghuangia soli]MCF2525678.1 adenylosuccinate synthetase [Yinghuangia soli]